MKKYLVILGALLMVAGSAFGQTTFANQDSCDISVSPAATLLLPYFSVDPAGETTLVTITNVSSAPAVAHFTVWSNLSFPVLDFNVYLTGYDVQGISLTDLLVNGTIPSTGTPTTLSPQGDRSQLNGPGNPNALGASFASAAARCGFNQGGTGIIPPGLLADVQSGLTGGGYQDCNSIALPTDTMVGYITIDVVNQCSQNLPTSGNAYFNNEMLFDNQLIGDYIRIDGAGGVSGASPLVHIKAVPFGGPVGTVFSTFPRSFYERYGQLDNLDQPGVAPFFDRRQPLPAKFAARYIEPGTGLGFDTALTIWREGVTNSLDSTVCVEDGGVSQNATTYVEIVRFDERENPTTFTPSGCTVSPCPDTPFFALPETSAIGITSSFIPPDSGTADPAGWLYMNLANPAVNVANPGLATQAWVQIRMSAAGLFGVDFDAAYMSNGCSSYQDITGDDETGPLIAPHIN